MKNKNYKKGFTLIEMLVVVAVISILSGLTLTGIAGFTSRARDTRRLGDISNVRTYVEAFFSKCGHYPGTSSSGTCSVTAPTAWGTIASSPTTSLRGSLNDAIAVNVPVDPVLSKSYFYAVSSDQLKYVLGTKLENKNSALDEAGELESFPVGSTWTPVAGAVSGDCSDASPTFGYCIGS